MRQSERTRGVMGEGERGFDQARAIGDVTFGTEIWGLISGGSATEVMAATSPPPGVDITILRLEQDTHEDPGES